MNEIYIDIALNEAKKAYKNGDIPVGCVIVKENKIIAKTHNKKEKNKIATHHAEILAIQKACKKTKNWHLEDCVLYTTMEPCLMCAGAIAQARIKKIVYSVDNPKFGFTNIIKNGKISNHTIEVEKIDNNMSQEILISFFKNKR